MGLDRLADLMAEWRSDSGGWGGSAPLTVGDLLGYHRAHLRAVRKNVSEDHLAKSEWAYRHILARWPASALASEVAAKALLEYAGDLGARYSAGTVRGILVVLRAALVAAHHDGRLDRLPAVPVPAMPRRDVRVAEEDLARLWARVDLSKPTHLLLALVMGTGMREKDARGLRWEWFDWEARSVSFWMSKRRKETPKWVTFALFAPLPDRLQALRKAEGALFSGTWRRGSRVRRTVAYLLGHWGPPEAHQEGPRTVQRRRYVHGPAYGPHAFRHTLTSRLVDAGASLHEVKEAMGHDSIKTTLLYYHRKDSAPVLRMRDRLENDLTPSS